MEGNVKKAQADAVYWHQQATLWQSQVGQLQHAHGCAMSECMQLRMALHQATQKHSALEAENASLRVETQELQAASQRMATQLLSATQGAAETATNLNEAREQMEALQDMVRSLMRTVEQKDLRLTQLMDAQAAANRGAGWRFGLSMFRSPSQPSYAQQRTPGDHGGPAQPRAKPASEFSASAGVPQDSGTRGQASATPQKVSATPAAPSPCRDSDSVNSALSPKRKLWAEGEIAHETSECQSTGDRPPENACPKADPLPANVPLVAATAENKDPTLHPTVMNASFTSSVAPSPITFVESCADELGFDVKEADGLAPSNPEPFPVCPPGGSSADSQPENGEAESLSLSADGRDVKSSSTMETNHSSGASPCMPIPPSSSEKAPANAGQLEPTNHPVSCTLASLLEVTVEHGGSAEGTPAACPAPDAASDAEASGEEVEV
eukprot:RCo004356